ncbi:MAG: phage antirepressor KilAC domain-containing protein, partial [Ruminococcus sp.]|nr:phage antirepressor KilAC domain-containing protein [Ruminococcus sp.]
EMHIKQDSYIIDDPVKRAERWIEEQKEKQQLLATVATQEKQISELQPKASYYDVILNCPNLVSTSVIAKDYGKTAIWLNKFLHEKGVQFKQGDIWILYQKYADKGYTGTRTHCLNSDSGLQLAKVHTYWTQKGRMFIYDLLKSEGILPIVETEKTKSVRYNAC